MKPHIVAGSVHTRAAGPASPDLTVAVDEVFIGHECFQPHRAADVQLLRTDTDFGAKTKFKAIGEARRRIDIDGRRIDSRLESGSCRLIFRNDGFGMMGACTDPGSVLGTVGVRGAVDYTVVHGRVTVRDGRLVTVDEEKAISSPAWQ